MLQLFSTRVIMIHGKCMTTVPLPSYTLCIISIESLPLVFTTCTGTSEQLLSSKTGLVGF